MRNVLPVAGRDQLGHFVAGVRLLPVSGETDVLSQELRITAGRSTEDGRLEGVTRQCLSPHCAQRPAPPSAIRFHQMLGAAKLYLHLRWLEDKPETAVSVEYLWRYRHLRA